jgi:hypothetical protein
MNWPKNGVLTADQTGHPLIWYKTLEELGYTLELPYTSPRWFEEFWGDGKTSSRIQSWGHADPRDKASPHFLCTRGGLPFHTDPGYTRYALQVQLYNDGYLVRGIADDPFKMPLFKRGLVTLLDTYSPHGVLPDPRLRLIGRNKLLAGMDFTKMPDPERELAKIVAYIPHIQEAYDRRKQGQ